MVLEDITAQTIPEDFARNQKVHHCYIVRRLPIEDAMAEVGFSAEEIAERVEELRNPEARKPRAAVPGHVHAGDGKPHVTGRPPPRAARRRQARLRRQAQKEEVLRQQAQGQITKLRWYTDCFAWN